MSVGHGSWRSDVYINTPGGQKKQGCWISILDSMEKSSDWSGLFSDGYNVAPDVFWYGGKGQIEITPFSTATITV